MGGTIDVRSVTPDAFGPGDIASGNTIVLGAPHIGKSELVAECAEDDLGIDVAETLSTTTDRDVLVVDEFDRAWHTAATTERDAFVERLGAEPTCVVTRPYALDWLLQSDETGFDAACLDSFDRILLLQYERDDEAQRVAAIERCMDIGTDDGEGSPSEGGVSRTALNRELDQLTYRYEFDGRPIRDAVERYGESVVPPLVAYVSLSGVDEGLLAGGVADACSELAENFALSEFLSDTKELALDVLSGEGGQAVGAALAGAVPVGGAASLLLWAYLRENDDGPDEVALLDTLAGAGTTPTARAELEAELGLPPRTLDDLHWLLRDDGLAWVREACETSPERVAEFESAMAAHGARLDELETTVERLDAAVAEFRGLYSEHLRNATKGIGVVGEQLARDEATLLDPLVDRDEIDVANIPYFEEDDDGDGPPRIESLVATVREAEMVVLRGPSGTGKTTAAYRVGRRLEADGDAVRIPNLSTHSAEFVRQTLERSVDAERVVMYVSYRVGADETVVEDDDLRQLKRWVKDGVCDGIVVECRSEVHESFEGKFGEVDAQSTRLRKRTLDFSRFTKVQQAVGVVLWVAEYVGAAEPTEERMQELVRLSEGNPEILKLAAKFEFSDDHSLDDVTTADGVVLKELQNLYRRNARQQQQYEQLFVLLSVTGGLTTAELRDLLGTSGSDLVGFATEVRGYLNPPIVAALSNERLPDDDAVWRLSPDIFGDVTVRNCLSGEPTYDFWWAYRRLFRDERERSYGHHLFAITQNLGVAYDALRRGEDEPERDRMLERVDDERCLAVVDDVLERAFADADAVHVVEALVPLASEGVPFSSDVLDGRLDEVVDAAGEGDRFDASAGPILQTVFGHLYGNLVVGGDSTETVTDLVERIAVECRERHGRDSSQFLSNVYSIVLSNLADDYTPAEADDWLDAILDRTWTAATDAPHDADAAPFLENVYSMAIENLADHYTPAEVSEWVTVIDRASRRCAENGPHDHGSADFLALTRASAVGKVTPENPRHESTWHQYLLDRYLSETNDEADTFYSRYHFVLPQLRDIDDWLPWIVADAVTRTAADGEIAIRPGADVLCEAVRRLRYDPNYPTGLDTNLGKKTFGEIAPIAVEDPDAFDRLVTETATDLRAESPADWLADGFGVEPSEAGATEFIGHAYARALPSVAEADEGRLEPFHDRAVNAAERTADPSTALTTFYSRALPWFSAGALPEEDPDHHRWLLEQALANETVDTVDCYSPYLARLHRSESHDPSWFVALAVDAVDRLRTGTGVSTDADDRVMAAATVAAEALHLHDRAHGMSGEVPDRVVAAVEAVEDEVPDLFDPFVEATADRMESDHDALLLAGEWRLAFGAG